MCTAVDIVNLDLDLWTFWEGLPLASLPQPSPTAVSISSLPSHGCNEEETKQEGLTCRWMDVPH